MAPNLSLEYATVRRGTIVRPMSPLGTYWSQSSLSEVAAYVVRDDLIFTACHFDQGKHEGDYYSEFDDPTPEEIRLMASLALPIGSDRGSIVQYPCIMSVRLEECGRLDDSQVIAKIETVLRSKLGSDIRRARSAAPLPPSGYSHFHWPLPLSTQRELLSAIDTGDHLMIRGLATWMKASMLNMHEVFGEEANYPLWISLDASFELIQEIIRAQGVANPSATDCQAFIHDAFGEVNSGLRYFEEFYEDRIKTMHPQSRFGTFAFAPISHCDFYALHGALREVYRFILLNEVLDPQHPFDNEAFWALQRASQG